MEVLGEVQKNQKEIIRVCIAEYRKKPVVDLRICWLHDGEYLFTKRGISVKPEDLDTIIKLLQGARKELKHIGR